MTDLRYMVEPVITTVSDGMVKTELGVERVLKHKIPEVTQVVSA